MKKIIASLTCLSLTFIQGSGAQDESQELRQTYAQMAGMAIAAAQACPNLALSGAQLEIMGASVEVTIDNLLDDLAPDFQGGFVTFQTSFNDNGPTQACEAAWGALGSESDLQILERN